MVVVGKITDEKLNYWIPMVNAEYGLSDKNQISVDYFKAIAHLCDLIENEKYYVVSLDGVDMWGNRNISIISWYIKPKYRTMCTIKRLQSDIIELAKQKNVKYILQGSHLNEKLLKLLGKLGYKAQTLKLEI